MTYLKVSFIFEFSLKINILLSFAGISVMTESAEIPKKMARADQNRPQPHPANVSLKTKIKADRRVQMQMSCCRRWTNQTFLSFKWIKAAELADLHHLRAANRLKKVDAC